MNISFPAFVSSDAELNTTYDYRCGLYRRHVKATPAGHVITEFLPDVPWAGIYNTISCAAGHHLRDGRWMHQLSVPEEYAAFWCAEGDPRLYSFALADSVLALASVTGNFAAADALYPKLAEIHQAWDDHRTACGMYRQLCDRDGMEYSISGNGIRPTINSYMYAEKQALAILADRAQDACAAQNYRRGAEELRRQINDRLWNASTGMYGVLSDSGEPQNVRELIGYIPWIYGIPCAGRDGCFRNLLDPACFLAPHGLRTADASHPEYMKPFDHECLWNGPVWPFATAQALTAVIEYLHTAGQPVITPDEFMQLFLAYARSHRDEDGTPYLDENMHPDTGVWLARQILRSWNRSETDVTRGRHYNHSSFIDLVMTGVCGIRPAQDDRLVIRPLGTVLEAFSAKDILYHGRMLQIDWEKKTGLRVAAEGAGEYFRPAADGEVPEIAIQL